MIKTVRALVILLLITLALEATLFNYRHFEALTFDQLDCPPPVYSAAIVTQPDGSLNIDPSLGTPTITLSDINAPVKNIYIDIDPKDGLFKNDEPDSLPASHVSRLSLSATDEANSLPLGLPDVRIADAVEDTKYIRLQLSGQVGSLVINLKEPANRTFVIRSIALNQVPPYQFSFWRIAAVFILLAAGWLLRPRSPLHKIRLNLQSKAQLVAIVAIVMLLACGLIMLTTLNPFYNGIENTENRSQYEIFAEMLLKGQLHFDYEVDPRLLEMENPYDFNARNSLGIMTRWDHALYNGKYYMYFGIVPELVLFLPYRVVTGTPLPTNIAVGICILAFAVGFAALLYRFARRYFPQASLPVYLMLAIGGMLSSGMIFAKYPTLYVVPIAASAALGVWGLYFWLGAKKDGGGLNIIDLFSGSLMIALIFGCRPQNGLIFLVAIPLFWDELTRQRAIFSKKGLGQTLALLLPFIAVAAGLMLYNNARFGSPFDFGAQYNLTTNDMTRRGFVLGRLPGGLFAFFFQLPVLFTQFPFIFPTSFSTSLQGISIRELTLGGVFFSYPLLLASAGLGRFRRLLREKRLLGVTILLLVIPLAIAIMDIEVAGIVQRYLADFLWMMSLAAAMIIMAALETADHPAWQAGLQRLLTFAFAYTVLFALLGFFATEPDSLSAEYSMSVLFHRVASLIEFWK